MNRHLLLTFLDVLDTRNFGRTADRLELTQSTVSARIRQLEEELDVRLFERGRGGAEPTKAGRRFEVHCRSLLALWGHAARDVRARQSALPTSLHVTAQYNLIRSYLLDWIYQLRAQNPDCALQIEINFSEQIQRDILSGETDIGIVFTPHQTLDLLFSEVGSEEYVMVSTKHASLGDVQLSSYIKISYTPYFERYHQEYLPRLSNPSLIAGCDDVAVEILRREGGTLYLPRAVAAATMETMPGLRPVHDAPVIIQPVYSVVHIRRQKDAQINQALKALAPFVSRSD